MDKEEREGLMDAICDVLREVIIEPTKKRLDALEQKIDALASTAAQVAEIKASLHELMDFSEAASDRIDEVNRKLESRFMALAANERRSEEGIQ